MEKTVSWTSGTGKTGELRAEEWNWATSLHQLQKSAQNGLKTWTQDLKNHKTPRRKYRQQLSWHQSQWWSFESGSKSKGNGNKYKQVRLHQTKKLLYSKQKYQQNETNEKTIYWVGKTFASYISVLYPKYIKNSYNWTTNWCNSYKLIQLNNKANIWWKMGWGSEETFF